MILEFVGGLGMNARFSKVSWDFFNTVIIRNGVLSTVDLLLSSHQDTSVLAPATPSWVGEGGLSVAVVEK